MDRYEAMQAVAASVRTGAGVQELVPDAISLCRQIQPHAAWDRYASLDWEGDSRHARDWLVNLLRDDPPDPTITGFWFGLFNPIVDGRPASDYYIVGSAHYPGNDWITDQDWEPNGRYAHSPAQAEMYGLAEGDGPDVLAIVDYVLTFAHAAATVNDLMAQGVLNLVLGESRRIGIAVGHDSGDALFLGELSVSGFDRSASDWI